VRLADTIFRSGHLSEQALVDVCMTGDRPVHLDRCDICADRAVELGRWLDDVRATGAAVADAAFPPERLAAQQTQIMRKLAQLDQPSRVISFPIHARLEDRHNGTRRVAPVWVGVGVAAGLLVGVIGGQVTARLERAASPIAAPAPVQTAAADLDRIQKYDEEEQNRPATGALDAIDALSPRLTEPGLILTSFQTRVNDR